MTKRQSSLERLGNFKVTFDDATDQILGLVDAHGQERQLVTAATGPGGGIEFSDEIQAAIAGLAGGDSGLSSDLASAEENKGAALIGFMQSGGGGLRVT